ncbi:MAG: SpoIIE family protein phosphatase, partial [candidate division Zixibacteria bacterium]
MNNPIPDKPKKRPLILLVDDESIVTTSISSLLSLETDYDAVCFSSPHEALKFLKQQTADMVVSDFLMPDMNGLEFLREVSRLYPEIPRILLTGYADKENAIRAINEVGLFQYLEKPWDNDELKIVIRNGIEQYSLRAILKERATELSRAIGRVNNLTEVTSRLEEELKTARSLQEKLLPTTFSAPSPFSVSVLWQPAMEIGGDFYDMIELANGHIAYLVADMTGHGIQAALSTALLKFAFTRFAGQSSTPGELLRGINDVLYEGLPSGIFAAAAVVCVDLDNRQCHIANAGLPHPLWLRHSAGSFERVAAEGLLLGVAPGEAFQPGDEMTIKLAPGDSLLLATDGLHETADKDGEFFESLKLMETLRDWLSNSEHNLLELLVQSANIFRGNEQAADDITLLLLQHRSDGGIDGPNA